MRVFLMTLIAAATLAGCGDKTASNSDVVDGHIASSEQIAKGLDMCYAAVKAADGTQLSTSALAVQTTLPIVVYTFSAVAHGANYVCKVDMGHKEIVVLSKNDASILNDIAPKLRKF